MRLTTDAVAAALAGATPPEFDADLSTAVDRIEIADGDPPGVKLVLGFPAAGVREALANWVAERLAAAGLPVGCVEIDWNISAHAVQGKLQPLKGVKNLIAVASGKGGVGKSTVAVNLALALAAEGAHVGVLDADIYGPSQPRMLGLEGERPTSPDGKHIDPLVGHGLQCMSIGFLVDQDTPMIWRGPMVTQALTQFLNDTNWDNLDYLIIDMPPGTGDIALTLAQRVPVSGAIIVTTPQEIALLDARKGLKMFEKVDVNILGIVENMSTYICPKCGDEEPIFGAGGGQRLVNEYGTSLLGSLPLDLRIREQTDSGRPTVIAEPDSDIARAYRALARRAAAQLAQTAPAAFPNIVEED
ncbi:MAG TPA: iron-sulfur cluster carrier protein ApbC [Gammaproteobacteria bacterium]|nr:iron-sulfur cluster carrier protein ApbC [Gammaproteobacteria bacterium]